MLAGFRPSELYHLTPGEVRRSGVAEVPEIGEVGLNQLGIWVYLPVDDEGRPQHKTVHYGKPRADRGSKPRRDRCARSSYLQAVKRAAKRAGVAHWTPYQLLH